MAKRIGLCLCAAGLFLPALGAAGAVVSIPANLGASAGTGVFSGFPLSPAPAALFSLMPSAGLMLTPALAASPSIALQAAPVPSAASPDIGRPHGAGRLRMIRGFDSNILGNRRDVAVYLPPGYDTENARYPVLYMQDGQNVFDPATSYNGTDWGIAQTCDRLISSGKMAPVIVIAVYNSARRTAEYTPVADEGYGGGNGDAYGRFLSDELKPFVDANFKTRSEAENTAIMGSSLGGLISLHLAFTRPDIFSRAAALSPSLWWSQGHMTRWIRRRTFPAPRPNIWVDMGAREGDGSDAHASNIEGLRAFRATLRQRGWRIGAGLEVREIAGAEHNERFWRARAGDVLMFLFPPAAGPAAL